jgi:VanZ family protein
VSETKPTVQAAPRMGSTREIPDWIWPALLAALIVVASSRSQVATPAIAHIDKVAHFGVYAMLATMTVRLGRGGRAAAGALLAVSFFGFTDEWHQSFVPGRSSDVWDWVADTSGAAVAVLLYTGSPGLRRMLEYKLGQRRIENVAPAPRLPDA